MTDEQVQCRGVLQDRLAAGALGRNLPAVPAGIAPHEPDHVPVTGRVEAELSLDAGATAQGVALGICPRRDLGWIRRCGPVHDDVAGLAPRAWVVVVAGPGLPGE